MLEIYAQAWVIDEEMADLVRDTWYRGEIDEDQARMAWRCILGAGANDRRHEIRPTKQLKWISGLRAALKSIGAVPSDPYSWLAKTDDCYVFTAEIDHRDKARNDYRHLEGIFRKEVPPISASTGDSSPRIKHAHQLFDAIEDARSHGLTCQLLLEKGTKYGITPGGVRAAVDGDSWMATELSGDVGNGFQFVLERTE